MVDPLFWLGLSILLVAVSLTAVLVAALPAFRELARASRSAEKLFDTLSRELPPTLESIRMTGMEISDLTDEVSEGVQSAGRVVKQFDESIRGAKKQAKKAQTTTRSLLVGFKAAWRTFKRTSSPSRRSLERLPSTDRPSLDPDNNSYSVQSSVQTSQASYATTSIYEMQSNTESQDNWQSDYDDYTYEDSYEDYDETAWDDEVSSPSDSSSGAQR